MEQGKVRMIAHLIELNKIEVRLSKKYYGGISPKFYLRDLTNETLQEIITAETCDDDICIKYYFKDVDIDLNHHYQVVDNYGLSEILQYVRLTELENFDDIFYYDGKLGPEYSKESTTFRVWAPTSLEAMVKVGNYAYPMERKDRGVFEATVMGDLDNQPYNYLIRHHNNFHDIVDPYAYGSQANSKRSVVIDINKLDESLNREYLPHITKKTEAIIYEISIRDFTMSNTIKASNPGTFKSFVETDLKTPKGNKAGIDYLADLGITHVQIMPMYDFETVDELHPEVMYNWGYDPVQYNVPEGSYALDPQDGYSRVRECRNMVASLHAGGIRVVMDVVYNHMYNYYTSAFERTVPGYYFRKNQYGQLSNGSWCGNDLESRKKMVRRYIKDMCLRWQCLYGVDGFRFDLMGIIDIETLNQIYHDATIIDDSFIMYGEGWNMPTAMDDSEKGMQDNHFKMLNIGFFNDYYRETLKGGSGEANLKDKGYFAGNMYNCEIGGECMKNTKRYSYVDQSINYVECHDNATTFDKFAISNGDEPIETRKKRQLMLNVAILLSQGIPFIHCGQEFYRSKGGLNNTYNTLDYLNAVNWDLVDENINDIKVLKEIIKLRKENDGFKYETIQEVEENVEAKHFDYRILRYSVKQNKGKYQEIVAYFNPSYYDFEITDCNDYDVIYNDHESVTYLAPISMKIFGLKR